MLIDISVNNSKMKNVFPNSYGFKHGKLYNIKENGVNSSFINQDLHFGTHIDSPNHWIKGGKKVSDLDLNLFSGVCYVHTINANKIINKKILEKNLIYGTDRIFFKANSHLNIYDKFNPNFIGFDKSAVKYLLKNINIKVIGIDYLSIESLKSDGKAHIELLKNEVLIYECLNLKGVEDGFYKYWGYPILLDAEASPVRVIIEKINF